MNSKAIKRQLLAAIAMVLVAAIALGSSTYAWFVASGTVEAKGMKVQAQTDAGLTIRYRTGTWGTSATAAMDDYMKLYPASTTDLKDWYHATAESANSHSAKVGTRSLINSSVFPNGAYADNGYVLMRQFEIASTATDANALVKGLKVKSIKVTSPENTMSTALRVGIQYVKTSDGTTPFDHPIFAPVTIGEGGVGNEPTTEYNVYKNGTDAQGQTIDELVGKVTVVEPDSADAIIIPVSETLPAKSSNGVKVNIYIWFEGEDENLNTDNFGADELNVTVEFTGLSTGQGTAATKVNLSGASISNAENTNKTVAGVTYYVITGATASDGSTLYADTTTWTTATQVYTISDAGLVTNYTDNVKLPTST